jgi:hypothetical protein
VHAPRLMRLPYAALFALASLVTAVACSSQPQPFNGTYCDDVTCTCMQQETHCLCDGVATNADCSVGEACSPEDGTTVDGGDGGDGGSPSCQCVKAWVAQTCG